MFTWYQHHGPDSHVLRSQITWPPSSWKAWADQAHARRAAALAQSQAELAGVTSSASAAAANSGMQAGGRFSGGLGGGCGGGYRGLHGYDAMYSRRRYGIGRRLVWFGLGAAAASWYIHHRDHRERERQREHDQYQRHHHHQASISPSPNPPTQGPRSSYLTHSDIPPSISSAPWTHSVNPQIDNSKPNFTPAPSHPISDILNQQQGTSVEASPVMAAVHYSSQNEHDGKTDTRRRWGWRRHREPGTASQSQSQSSKNTDVSGSSNDAVSAEEQVVSMQQELDQPRVERRKAALEIQELANEEAQEYAKDKLEVLSKAVDSLRESLKADSGEKRLA